MANHYEVLGLTKEATPEDIKKRFRELARRWHPDVAGSPDAAERFKAINEAYRVLGNPRTKAQYDAELKIQARAQGDRRAASTTPPRGRSHGTAKDAPPRSGPAAGSAPPRRAQESATTLRVNRLLHEAEVAIQRMRLHEAMEICRRVLTIDRRNATAHEMLGDIYGMRGNMEAALSHYTIAVQLDPRNARLRQKFEQAAAEGIASHSATSHSHAVVPARQALALMLGLAAIAAVITLAASAASVRSAGTWQPQEASPAVLMFLPAAGVIAGWVCAYAGIVRPARRELMVVATSRRQRSVVPMGVILVVLSLACFWLAGVLYALASATQDALSRSIIAAFIICACLIGMFAAVLPDLSGIVLSWGGNMLFPAFVGGWALGDRARSA